MISIKSDIKAITKKLNDIQKKQIPFAVSKALNATAFEAKKDADSSMSKYFDNPTPFTLKGVKVKRSTKKNLTARVFIQENRTAYLRKNIEGGTVLPKRKAFVLPTNIKLNKYGNMPKGRIQKLFNDPKVFSGIPKGYPEAIPGLWKRTGKKKNKKYERLATFKQSALTYRPRWNFPEIVKSSVRKNFRREFEKAFAFAMKSAK